MASAWILAIDQGTTNTKALLIDGQGQTVFRASTALELLQPRAGYVEQAPLALWGSVCQVIGDCVRFAAARGAAASRWAMPSPGSAGVPRPCARGFAGRHRRFKPLPDCRLTRY
ncbi:MAG: FGGY family carbohydrate kinase [Terracidiphilus sp.]